MHIFPWIELKMFLMFLIFSPQINAKRLHMHESTAAGLMAIIDPNEIPYFYKPILWPEELLPLSNLVVVFSLYSSDERAFLLQLAEIMGASVQESYSRQSKPLLICSEAKSAKYDAAIRWSKLGEFIVECLPIVNPLHSISQDSPWLTKIGCWIVTSSRSVCRFVIIWSVIQF